MYRYLLNSTLYCRSRPYLLHHDPTKAMGNQNDRPSLLLLSRMSWSNSIVALTLISVTALPKNCLGFIAVRQDPSSWCFNWEKVPKPELAITISPCLFPVTAKAVDCYNTCARLVDAYIFRGCDSGSTQHSTFLNRFLSFC